MALQRAALLPPHRAPPRGALRHELGLRAAAPVRAGVVESAGRDVRTDVDDDLVARPPATLGDALAATPESLLATDAIAFAPAAADDIAHHVADQRLVALLAWIAQRHSIVVTIIRTGHAKYVAGTHKVSNHWYGRAATISEVDGEPVSARVARRGRALGRAADGAPRRIRPDRDRRPLVESGQPALVHRPRREGDDPRRLRRRRREEGLTRGAYVTLTLPCMPFAAWPLMAQ